MKPVLVEQLLESYIRHRLDSCRIVAQSGEQPALFSGSFDVVDGLLEPEDLSEIAANLARLADEFQRNHEARVREDSDRISSNSRNMNQNSSNSRYFSLTSVADGLSTSLSPETFKRALHSVCQHATSLPVEIALAFELAAHLYRMTEYSSTDFIPGVISRFFAPRINMEDLRNIDP